MRASTQTKLTNTETNAVIVLSDSLYPNDEHDWSDVVSTQKYALDGTLIIEQSVRLAGKPYTMQAPDNHGTLSRETLNELKAACNTLEATYWLDYLADDAVKRVKVVFDHSSNPITAKPVRGGTSPMLSDRYNVVIKLIEIPSI